MTELRLDLDARFPIHASWTFGGDVGSAALLLRTDVQRQLRMCHEELTLRHFRCGGWLTDARGVMREDGSFDFTQVERALDALMEGGSAPFLDLSLLPSSLAGAAPDGPAIAGAPADWQRWRALIGAFAGFIDGRYGCDAREWHFQIGAAPDVGQGGLTREAALKRYDLAAAAIKEVHPEFRVGMAVGESTAADFLAHAAGTSEDYALAAPRCDFLVAAPTDGEAAGALRRRLTDAFGEAAELIVVASGAADRLAPPAGEAAASNAPTYENDRCASAARLAARVTGMSEHAAGVLVGRLTDITDEPGRCHGPFHNGAGLLTVNDVRKAGFQVLRLLGEHRGYHAHRVGMEWTDPTPGLGALASIDEYTLRLLCWHDPRPGAGPTTARFSLAGLSSEITHAQVEVVRPSAGSAYEAWVELGRPPFLNLQSLHDLEVASQTGTAEVDFREYPPRLEPGMVMQFTIPLPYEGQWRD